MTNIVKTRIIKTKDEYVVQTYRKGRDGKPVRYPLADYFSGGLEPDHLADAKATADVLMGGTGDTRQDRRTNGQ